MKITLLIAALVGHAAWSEVSLKPIKDDRYEATFFGGTQVKLQTGAYYNFFAGSLPAPKMEDVQKLLSKLNQMNQVYGSVLSIPEELKLRIWAEAGPEDKRVVETGIDFSMPMAGYDYERNELTLGIVFTGMKDPSSEKSLPVSAHEYGHVLFSSALEKTIPMFAAFIAELRDLREAVDKINNKYFGFDGICKDGKTTADTSTIVQVYAELGVSQEKAIEIVQQACTELAPLEQKVNEMNPRKPTILANRFELSKYHELFADTVAVVDSDNLESMVYVTGGEKIRSFSTCSSATLIKAEDPHTYFSLTRCEIGRLYLASRKAGVSKPDF